MAGWQTPVPLVKRTFFGWLNELLEPVPKKTLPPASETWEGNYLGIEGMQELSGVGMEPEVRAYEIKAEEIVAIQKYNSKGFTSYEINPRLLSSSDYFCALPPDEFYETIGSATVSRGVDFQAYKSVILPITGNYLRIEFGPPKFRDNQLGDQPFRAAPNYSAAENLNDGPIFLNFADVNGKAFKIRHGDTFKGYFNTIILSFPGQFSRIRVITGFNSEFQSNSETIPALHMAGTDVLANGVGYLKPTPIAVGNDQGGDTAIALGTNTAQSLAVIAQTNTSFALNESNFGWVTALNFCVTSLAVGRINVSLISGTTAGGKILWQKNYVLAVGDNQIDEKWETPLRFYASGFNGLVFRVSNSTGSDISNGRFYVMGYALGPVYKGANRLPQYFRYSLDHLPWGIDVIN